MKWPKSRVRTSRPPGGRGDARRQCPQHVSGAGGGRVAPSANSPSPPGGNGAKATPRGHGKDGGSGNKPKPGKMNSLPPPNLQSSRGSWVDFTCFHGGLVTEHPPPPPHAGCSPPAVGGGEERVPAGSPLPSWRSCPRQGSCVLPVGRDRGALSLGALVAAVGTARCQLRPPSPLTWGSLLFLGDPQDLEAHLKLFPRQLRGPQRVPLLLRPPAGSAPGHPLPLLPRSPGSAGTGAATPGSGPAAPPGAAGGPWAFGGQSLALAGARGLAAHGGGGQRHRGLLRLAVVAERHLKQRDRGVAGLALRGGRAVPHLPPNSL